ncbi:cupin domain-containing protein [Streptomyces sp. BI20]|uniref:cupin domain-containing protein n=1 Tax=Streptomyces sp. BI20 TaxID=3403460 RepID=UPI003C747D53
MSGGRGINGLGWTRDARRARARGARGAGVETQTVAREVVIEPGANTGWHYHHVPIDVRVRAGTLTRILHDGERVVSEPGETFVEPAGTDRVHIGHNFGTTPVVLWIEYVLPPGKVFAVPAARPCC